jgi:uncharacterized surface protein with fasciclin (FAS1) repeats
MKNRRITSALVAGALAVTGALAASPPAAAAPGTTSLAEVLAADGNKLDSTWGDFDIVEKAVYRVLRNKPESAVGLLADGEVDLTAFVPTDRAFRRLVFDLTGDRKAGERGVLRALNAFADVDTLEAVLLYHVVPGPRITYGEARQADGAKLPTALEGKSIKVRVRDPRVFLGDRDFDDRNAKVLRKAKNINQGNKQIAHGINRVLRPLNL